LPHKIIYGYSIALVAQERTSYSKNYSANTGEEGKTSYMAKMYDTSYMYVSHSFK